MHATFTWSSIPQQGHCNAIAGLMTWLRQNVSIKQTSPHQQCWSSWWDRQGWIGHLVPWNHQEPSMMSWSHLRTHPMSCRTIPVSSCKNPTTTMTSLILFLYRMIHTGFWASNSHHWRTARCWNKFPWMWTEDVKDNCWVGVTKDLLWQ